MGRLDGAPAGVRRLGGVAAAALALSAIALGWSPAGSSAKSFDQPSPTRYSLAGGCHALRSESLGRFVERSGDGYGATAKSAATAEPFRMQATDLGKYLLYGQERDFVAIELLGGVAPAGRPSDAADWTVRERGGAFAIHNAAADRDLAVTPDGELTAVDAGSAGKSGRFGFASAEGCARYPEVEVNAVGEPTTGTPRYGETSGLIDAHIHHMAFEFLGGRAHCGRPWHRFGAPFALVDCPDHEPNGAGAVLENTVSYGNPVGTHDTDGWPSFAGWPHHASLTHEQTYYKWLERSWRGGLRIFVNLLVENRALCEAYPLKKNSCNEMDSVLLQAKRMRQLEDYIDAQSGGPGEGWFRIVRNPFQARRVINRGKLAVVMGMEVSEPFDCRIQNERPTCDREQIDAWIERLHRLGVRQLEIVNKFDNALTGVAGDGGATGTVVNTGNFYTTGRFWDLEHCDDTENSDNSPTAVELHNDDLIVANGVHALLPPGAAPVYPEPPHCNTRGLSHLGVHAIRQIMQRGMIFDPDHMGVHGRDQALTLLESRDYPGVVSSHSWSTENAYARIYRLGGVITPYAGGSEDFVDKWRALRPSRNRMQYFGFGYGADMNGFGAQGGPRGADVPNPVTYPFRSFDGEVVLRRQRSGTRAYDINVDGVAHYGLYPDWIEDLRMLAGERIVEDMGRGAEAYLQMWERAKGVEGVRCRGWRGSVTARGLAGLRLGDRPREVLLRAGQPVERGRTWRWCTGAEHGSPAERGVVATFDSDGSVGVVLSSLHRQSAAGISPGTSAGELPGRAEPLGGGVWARDAGGEGRFLFGVRGGRVSYVGVAADLVAESPATLREHLRRAVAR